ncbi:hypothetical protein CRUP_035832, partial [Coryphaenoides rupestris]
MNFYVQTGIEASASRTGYSRTGYSSYNSITSASSDEELLDGAGATMDFHTTEDDNLLDGDAASSP